MEPAQPRILARDLAPVIEVKPSGIHGLGVFARKDFDEGDYIGTYWGTQAKETTPYTLHVQNEDGTLFLIEGRNLLRYINHADRPNARFDGIHLYARQSIGAGEEITFDYGDGEGVTFPD
ncbi:SET domain-containing protein [Thiolapillus sp.]